MATGINFREAETVAGIDCEGGFDPGHAERDLRPSSAMRTGLSTLPIVGRLPGAARAAGVALCAPRDEAAAEAAFELWVIDTEGCPALRLGAYPESEVVAEWRRVAAAAGLVLMVIDAEGTITTAQEQIGRLRLGAVRVRRGHGLLTGRRPRFLVRRKPARLALRPQVHRDERVISGA